MAKDPYAFVKATGRDKYFKTQEEELSELVDTETRELKAELAKPVDCVVCGSKDHNLVFKKQGFRFVKCCDCGLLFVSPQLDDSKLIHSYKENESQNQWVDVLLSKKQLEYDAKHRFGEAVRRLEKRYPRTQRGTALDVGCSIGLFLHLMKKCGWKTRGMEINQKAANHAREAFGLMVDELLLHEADYKKESFQIISLWGVLEHTSRPDEILKSIHPLLEKKGTLALLVPNGHSLATRVMRGTAATFGGRNHLWYFSPETLTRLLERCGFKVVDLYTQLEQINELELFLQYNDPYLPGKKVGREEFKLKPALAKALSKFILANNLGYKLIVFAEKRG